MRQEPEMENVVLKAGGCRPANLGMSVIGEMIMGGLFAVERFKIVDHPSVCGPCLSLEITFRAA